MGLNTPEGGLIMAARARIDITFGHDHWGSVLDLPSGEVHRFNRPTGRFDTSQPERGSRRWTLFTALGGEQYYGSRSGVSGAGWVPAAAGRFALPTLQHWVARPRVPEVRYLFDRLRAVDLGQEVIAFVEDERVTFVPDWSVGDFLRRWAAGERWTEPARQVTLTSWTTPWKQGWSEHCTSLEEVRLELTVSGRLPRDYGLSERRVLELLYWKEIFDPAAHGSQESDEDYWVSGLGLARGADGRLYHQGGGILRRPVEEGALDTREGVETIAPWAKVVNDDLAYASDRYADGHPAGTVVTPRHCPPRRGLPSITPRQYAAVLMGQIPSEVAELAISRVDPAAPYRCGRLRVEEAPMVELCPEGHDLRWECELLGCVNAPQKGVES